MKNSVLSSVNDIEELIFDNEAISFIYKMLYFLLNVVRESLEQFHLYSLSQGAQY